MTRFEQLLLRRAIDKIVVPVVDKAYKQLNEGISYPVCLLSSAHTTDETCYELRLLIERVLADHAHK